MDTIKSFEDLNKTIHDLREASKAGQMAAEKADKLEQGVKDLTAALRTVEEARASEARTKLDRLTGPDSVLRDYVHKADDVTLKDVPKHTVCRDDSRAVRLFASKAADGVIEYGLLDDPEPRHEWQVEAQRALDDRNFCRMLQVTAGNRPHTPTLDRKLRRVMERAPGEVGAVFNKIFSDSANIGGEWIADQYSPMMERELELRSRLGGLFGTIPLTIGDTLRMPVLTAGLRPALRGGAPTTDDPARFNASSLSTDERTHTVSGMAVRVQLDEDSAEDAYIPVLNIIRDELLDAMIAGEDDVIINGDTATTHQDAIASWDIRGRWGSASFGALDHRKHSIGLRARAFDVSNTTDQNGAQTAAGLRTARGKLASAHALSTGVKHIVNPEYFLTKMLAFTETITWDKVGPNASVLTGLVGGRQGPSPGSVGFIDGVEIIMNWFMSADLAATGLYTGSGATLGALTVNTDRFKRLVRRGTRLQAQQDITRGVVDQVVSNRWKFVTLDGSTTKNVHYSFNLTTT